MVSVVQVNLDGISHRLALRAVIQVCSTLSAVFRVARHTIPCVRSRVPRRAYYGRERCSPPFLAHLWFVNAGHQTCRSRMTEVSITAYPQKARAQVLA